MTLLLTIDALRRCFLLPTSARMPSRTLSKATKRDGRFTCEGCGRLLGRTAWFKHRRLQCGQHEVEDEPTTPEGWPPPPQQTLVHGGEYIRESTDEEVEVTGGGGQVEEGVREDEDVTDRHSVRIRPLLFATCDTYHIADILGYAC